jgi:hypothetical protein
MNNPYIDLAQRIAARFAELPSVIAVAIAGSQMAQASDAHSDIDLYVYTTQEIDPMVRLAIAESFANEPGAHIEIDNRFFEPGDEWRDAASSISVDIMFRHPRWIDDQLNRLLVRYEASVGYSTAFWFNVLNSHPLFDRDGWYAQRQQQARQPYPDSLARNIIAKNHSLLRNTQSSYRHQIELAVERRDRVSVNHRIAALLASYFDVLFALNRLPHPGEKRLIAYAEAYCKHHPVDMKRDIEMVLINAGEAWEDQHLLREIDKLLDGLDALLDK